MNCFGSKLKYGAVVVNPIDFFHAKVLALPQEHDF
jgi:hypothetical protein